MQQRNAYWIVTGLVILWILPSGVIDLIRLPSIVAILQRLGYPTYVCLILGPAKLLAVAALIDPRTRLLREWAYAGLTFELLGGFISHVATHDPISIASAPLILLALVVASYMLRPEKLRLQASK